MKKIYIIIIFLIFFNIFSFMFAWFGVFPTMGDPSTGAYDVNTTGEGITPGEVYIENISGMDYGDMVSVFFGDLSDSANIFTTFLIMGVAIVAAWLTHSPAPLVIAFIGNFVRVAYLNTIGIFSQYPINNYFMLAFAAGMVVLFGITCAEYLTHGDV